MENKNMPELYNPMISLMQGNMPGLPSVIENAMPIPLPRMNYNDNPVSMIFGNFKLISLFCLFWNKLKILLLLESISRFCLKMDH